LSNLSSIFTIHFYFPTPFVFSIFEKGLDASLIEELDLTVTPFGLQYMLKSISCKYKQEKKKTLIAVHAKYLY